MLPSSNRLVRKQDFELIKKEGRKYQSNFFGVLVKSTEENSSRFGFIVSTKISKKAAERNKIKRLLRESIKTFLSEIKPGNDILFLVKKDILNKSFEEISKETKEVLKRANVI